MQDKENIMMFDVEATSLHGPGFAVGAIVVNKTTGKLMDTFQLMSARGSGEVNSWGWENVVPVLMDMPKCEYRQELRQRFFEFYRRWAPVCDIWGDCIFPVETNFLSEITEDDTIEREFLMPYPLYDLANFIDVNLDRNDECGLKNLRKHHPLDDCIASVVLLLAHKYNITFVAQ